MTEDELAHFGVKGMKWGRRNKVSSRDIHAARSRLAVQEAKVTAEIHKTYNNTKAKTPERKAGVKRIQNMNASYLRNPDRVTASRLTAGEKVALGLLAATGYGAPAAAGIFAGNQVASRVIEAKQRTGAYNKKK